MNNILKCKDFTAEIKYDPKEKIIYGKIQNIPDVVTFEADSMDNIEHEFHEAVDDYIETKHELEIMDKNS